ELLRDKTGTRDASSPAPAAPLPVERPAPAPRPAPVPVAPELRQSITLSMQTIWMALGVAILLGFGIWAIAWTAAKRRTEREMAPYGDRPPSTQAPEPLHKEIPANPNLVTPGPPKQTPPVATPPSSGDPRVAGLNYLTIASRL